MQETNIVIPMAPATTQASIGVDFGAGELNITSGLPGTTDLIAGQCTYPEAWGEPAYSSDPAGETHFVRVWPRHDPSMWPSFGRGPTWNLAIRPGVPATLVVHTGASRVNLDLREVMVRSFTLELGASDTSVTFPAAAGQTTAAVKGGAASFKLFVPTGVGARIKVTSGLASVDVEPRFRRQEGYYISDDYATAPNRLDLKVEVGVSSVSIRSA